MFSSLDRIDIVLKPGPDGRRTYVQTDHRSAAEVEEEPELSVLFALTRVLNPKRMAGEGEPEPVVLYTAQELPPPFLRQAVRAAGRRITVGTDERPVPDDEEPPPLGEVIASAFATLARAVATEHGVRLTVQGLEKVEAALADEAGDPEEDEVSYWSAVMKLGTFGGELIRASNGGRWQVVDSGTLPFALVTSYQGGEATVNPLGKAVKRFANGEEDSLVALVNVLRQS
jgi:hypothetical protein